MCLLKVKIRKREKEEVYNDIAVIEFTDGLFRIYNLTFEKILEIPASNIRKLFLNSVDAHLLIDLE